MTVHRSKGLEADVVFLFGGFARSPVIDPVSVYHNGGRRRVVVRKLENGEAGSHEIEQEQREEDERLLYVALTRAKLKLYVPFLPDNSLKQKCSGYYKYLNER